MNQHAHLKRGTALIFGELLVLNGSLRPLRPGHGELELAYLRAD